jgi:hypothetical protein
MSLVSPEDVLLIAMQIRVYYVTARGTLGEVAYNSGWNGGSDLNFAVADDSSLLYAIKAGNVLVVGYTNVNGNLSEAYIDLSITPLVWQTYEL